MQEQGENQVYMRDAHLFCFKKKSRNNNNKALSPSIASNLLGMLRSLCSCLYV